MLIKIMSSCLKDCLNSCVKEICTSSEFTSEYDGKWGVQGHECCFNPLVAFSVLLIPGGCCVVSGMAAGRAGQESCFKWCLCPLFLLCIGGAINRNQVRKKLELDGRANCGLFCIHLFCMPCAVCQEYNTVAEHFNPTKEDNVRAKLTESPSDERSNPHYLQ
jgi:Cys-rich protein (TIGR01571 family)